MLSPKGLKTPIEALGLLIGLGLLIERTRYYGIKKLIAISLIGNNLEVSESTSPEAINTNNTKNQYNQE
jgi:hypothetical protein